MDVVVVTGSGGLIGSEASRHFSRDADLVIGIDNDLRARFFGEEASTAWSTRRLEAEVANYRHVAADIRDESALERVFGEHGRDIRLVVHTAAQPSHDWAAKEPLTDFGVNATGTLLLLEATRRWCPDAAFVFTSTNKVYGDTPNRLPLYETDLRWELEEGHPYAERGIDETMTIDASLHSLFGASKVSADVLVQEYGRYFGLRTVAFRAGCLTGPAHSCAQLHGFLAYLMKCAVTGQPYTVFGYKGKQVRDNLHAADLVAAFDAFYRAPRSGEVYNIGGGRVADCSMLEAIETSERIAGRALEWTYDERNRRGDHMWWVSDTSKFQAHFPQWRPTRTVEDILVEIHEHGTARWGG